MRGLRMEMFGDGWDILSLLGARPASGGVDAPVMALGVVRAPGRERIVDYWAFKRDVRAQLVEQVAEHRPVILVLVIDATDRSRQDKVIVAAKSLVSDTAHSAAMLADEELPVIGVVVRTARDRKVVASALSPRRFEQMSADEPRTIAGRLCVMLGRLGLDVVTSPRIFASCVSA